MSTLIDALKEFVDRMDHFMSDNVVGQEAWVKPLRKIIAEHERSDKEERQAFVDLLDCAKTTLESEDGILEDIDGVRELVAKCSLILQPLAKEPK